jgi:hypothetical protein
MTTTPREKETTDMSTLPALRAWQKVLRPTRDLLFRIEHSLNLVALVGLVTEEVAA